MKKIKKLNLEEFESKYSLRKRISCGINYEDGSIETVLSMPFSYIMFIIKRSKKVVKYIATS